MKPGAYIQKEDFVKRVILPFLYVFLLFVFLLVEHIRYGQLITSHSTYWFKEVFYSSRPALIAVISTYLSWILSLFIASYRLKYTIKNSEKKQKSVFYYLKNILLLSIGIFVYFSFLTVGIDLVSKIVLFVSLTLGIIINFSAVANLIILLRSLVCFLLSAVIMIVIDGLLIITGIITSGQYPNYIFAYVILFVEFAFWTFNYFLYRKGVKLPM